MSYAQPHKMDKALILAAKDAVVDLSVLAEGLRLVFPLHFIENVGEGLVPSHFLRAAPTRKIWDGLRC